MAISLGQQVTTDYCSQTSSTTTVDATLPKEDYYSEVREATWH